MKKNESINYLNQISQDGFEALKNGRSTIALQKFQMILEKHPNNSKILNLVGLCYVNLKKLNIAKEYFSKAIKNNPEEIGFHINLGNILIKNRDYALAEKIYIDALKFNKESPELHYNLGVVYSLIKNFKKSKKHFIFSLNKNKNNKFTLNNLGTTMKELGDFEKAKEVYKKAIKQDNFFSEAKYNLGLVSLLIKPDKIAWENYEYREDVSSAKKIVLEKNKIQKWNGSSLKNKSLIIYSEQGIGDNIQFARYIKLIKKENTKIIFCTNNKIQHLIKNIKEIDEVIISFDKKLKADYYISIMSLPYIYRFEKNLPRVYDFIFNNEKDNLYWRKKIKQNKKYKIGLVWQGDNKLNVEDYKRSVSLNTLDPILRINNIQYISLQKDIGKEQIEQNNYEKYITDYFVNIDKIPFKDTIPIIRSLDLVITVDTAIAHISATIGKETWVLLPFVPDFRWGYKGSKTPWYEKIRLFRQKKIGSWDNVIKKIKINLMDRIKKN